MKTKQLIELLNDALAEYGNVPVQLVDSGTGEWIPAQSLIKLHPYTGRHGCMNREEPVNALAITRCQNNAKDLVLGMAN